MRVLVVAMGAGLLALLTLRAWRLGPRRVLLALLHGAAWRQPAGASGLPASDSLLWWLAHACGLAYLWRLSGQRYLWALPLGAASAALLLLPQWPALWRRRELDVTCLTPLGLAYGVGLLWGLHLLPAERGLALVQAAKMAAVGYILLAQLERRWSTKVAAPAALALLAGTGLWALWEYLFGRTQGVTGSDPYCYAQMAVDFARSGDPRHVFGLLRPVRDLGIAWWPLVHVGYHVPDGTTGVAATVWPVGWPVLLAAGYRLLGEAGLYLWAPLMGLAALAATAALLVSIWPEGQPRARWLGIALALLVLATSREQVLQLLVPMADVPTELFTVLAVWLALRAGRRRSWPLAALAGGMLGVAYDMRHTQVFLAPVLVLALWLPRGGPASRAEAPRRRADRSPFFLRASASLRELIPVVAAGLGACLAAAPDLLYHRLAFGSLWRPESPELYLIGWGHWWGNAARMAVTMASRAEFGLLLPFFLYGCWRLWHDERRGAAVLSAWVLLSAGTQCLYGPLRWRDLLSIVPALAVLTAYGAVALLQRVRRMPRLGSWAPGWIALALAVLLAWRTGTVLAWPTLRAEMTFGYLTTEQRRAFDELARLVEPEAVVGSSLNSGPIELYTGREAFRPGDWSAAELEAFLDAMAASGRPAYVLEDGSEQDAALARLQAGGKLEPICALSVPLYGERDQLSGMLYRIKVSKP